MINKQLWPLAAILIGAMALAIHAQPRTINFTAPLLGLDGKPMYQPQGSDVKTAPVAITLSDICVGALYSQLDEDRAIQPTEKGAAVQKTYALAQKIYNAKAVELSIEETALILHRIPLAFPVVYAGPAMRMLEGTKKESK